MLKYPNFSHSEYACVSPNLKIVDFIMELEEIEKQSKIWEAERARLNAQYGCEGHSLMVFLQNRVLEHRDKVAEEDRTLGLKRQVEKFRQVMKMPAAYSNEVRINSIVGELLYLYGSFNNEQFEKDLNDLLADEIEKVGDLEKQYSTVNGHIGQWKRKFNALWKNVGDVFKDGLLPKHFRLRTSGPHCSEIEIAEAVIKSFAKDWRERCRKFDRPVTITGIEISSMPEDQRKTWMDAYNKLDLGNKVKYPKKAIFAALKSKDKTPLYTENKSLPGKFGGVVLEETE